MELNYKKYYENLVVLEYNPHKTNAEIIEETYFQYHGKYDDGESIADMFENSVKSEVIA